MNSRLRTALLTVAAALHGACANVPVTAPEDLSIRTNMVSPRYSSINASVLREDGGFDHTFAASLDKQVDTLTRLESRYTYRLDDDETLRIGDTVSTSGMWGTAVRYGGLQFGTYFEPRRDIVISDRLATSGTAVLPSAADALFASVRRDQTLFARQALSVDGALSIPGPNTVSFVARDAFGRSDTFTAPIIENIRLVEPGCNDFSLGLGKVRRDYAVKSNDYGPMFANATVTCGGPFGLTIEGHGEYLADEVTAFGIGVARRLGALGTASVAIASSRAEAGSGSLTRIGFDHENSLFNFKVRSLKQSRAFRDLGDVATEHPIMSRDLASVGVKISENSSLALAYATQVTWDDERINLISLSQRTNIGHASLSMTAGHSLEDNFGSSVFISYKRPFAPPPRRADSDIDEVELAP
ncbi:MAG: hypothetical protein DIU71_07860 [Proteobacteria bacterium]|nr:MAG: hypothetical protein DIU71_07860 [Pseudomonadota bacterium]